MDYRNVCYLEKNEWAFESFSKRGSDYIGNKKSTLDSSKHIISFKEFLHLLSVRDSFCITEFDELYPGLKDKFNHSMKEPNVEQTNKKDEVKMTTMSDNEENTLKKKQ